MRNLKFGEHILATVEEVLPESALIVSVEGELFRVVNETGLKVKNGDQLKLTVTQVNPTLFKLQKYESSKIDRFV